MDTYQRISRPDVDAYDILADGRRRHTINILREAETPLSLADVTMAIAKREGTETADEDKMTFADRIRLSLYHHHVPKMEDADVVEFNDARRTVELAETEERRMVESVNRSVESDDPAILLH